MATASDQPRAERLNSAASGDTRISFGCTNVPPQFLSKIDDSDFGPRKGIAYVLPERDSNAIWIHARR